MRTRATFRLWGANGLSARAVTEALDIDPSKALEAGHKASERAAPRTDSAWLLSSAPEIEDGVEAEEQLRRLVDRLEPVADRLWALVRRGYEANWYCWVDSYATEHASEFPRELLQRLLALPGDLWIDVVGGDTPDD